MIQDKRLEYCFMNIISDFLMNSILVFFFGQKYFSVFKLFSSKVSSSTKTWPGINMSNIINFISYQTQHKNNNLTLTDNIGGIFAVRESSGGFLFRKIDAVMWIISFGNGKW